MLRSFFFRLVGAFALVILALAVGVTLLASRATAGQFRLYTDRNGRLWAERLAPTLADYYARTRSWQGVEVLFQSSTSMMGGGMMGQGMGGQGAPSGMAGNWDMWAMMGQRLIVADAAGRIVGDSAGGLAGKALSDGERVTGVPIILNGQRIGTVVVASAVAGTQTPTGEFLSAVNRSILLAALFAGILALTLGGVLFFQLTAPIRRLTAAAHAIAAGDLNQRVAVHSRDELGELAGAFNAMAANLAASEGQRRQLVADVAHELRTPLSVLQANLEAMQDGILPTDAEQLASLHEETLLLGRLVADLRLLSLAEAGQLKLELVQADLGDLVRRAAERLRPAATAKGVDLVTQITPDSPRVKLDIDRFTQMLGNLVDNALRYTPGGGRIVLAVGWGGEPGKAHRPTVTVTDTGSGIPPDDLPHVFDRFYRGDKSRARASGGSGLGLAIVRQLVEAHHGTVRAESPVFHAADGSGFGTRIVVMF